MAGCNRLRLAPNEQQKQNAWLHNRTTSVVATMAADEQVSDDLQALTQLSQVQSQALAAYCGEPTEYPAAETPNDILSESNWQLATAALANSAERPEFWSVADTLLETAIAIAALFGGVFGTRVVQFLQDAREKSQALKEIIEGNELFKEQNPSSVEAFKEAQSEQSSETRQLVAASKS
jgi:hypothetical protein